LRAIDPAKIAVFVRPFVPDRYAVIIEPFDVRVAAQKPEQLVENGFRMNLFRGEQRKRIAQRTADLRAEQRISSRAGAVGFELSVFENVPEQIEVLNHRGKNLTMKSAREKEI